MPSKTVFGFDQAAAMLQRHQLCDLEALLSAGAGARSRHIGRAVWKTTLSDQEGNPVTAFVKMFWGQRRLIPRTTDLKTGQAFQSLALREWNGLQTFADHGFHVPRRIALFESGFWRQRSAIVIETVPPQMPFSELLRTGQWLKLPADDRHEILRTIVHTLCRVHQCGLAWRGSSTRHFFPQADASGGWKVWLIDCEGVHVSRSLATVERDFAKFERALRADKADSRTVEAYRKLKQAALASGLHHPGQPGGQRAAA